jgi:hypothetical protein
MAVLKDQAAALKAELNAIEERLNGLAAEAQERTQQ